MYLVHARLIGVPPFGDVSFPFCDAHGQPRLLTVLHGGGGVGKTSLLHALASTRPGHCAPLSYTGGAGGGYAVCQWLLSGDDPNRPHPLAVATPNAPLTEDDETGMLRRREQGLFDRKSRDGGFVFLALSSARWFSRQPVMLNAPQRTVAQYDVRAATALDDASRSDLTRETKQALTYAGLSAALTAQGARAELGLVPPPTDGRLLGQSMHEMVDALVQLIGHRYEGIDPVSLEPTFSCGDRRRFTFDHLPQRGRHLVCFGALAVRTLWAAYPGRDPRLAEGVVAIDEVDLHQDQAVQERLVSVLRANLPCVQWILTTSSPTVAAACDSSSVLALRRLPKEENVELFVGAQARTH